MAKTELIKDIFSRVSGFAGALGEYAKKKNKKVFINNFL